jgi:hypothetical protein
MRILLALTFSFVTITLQAQVTNTYLADLATLRSILQKTPSYKDQIAGSKLSAYDSLYERLRADTTAIGSPGDHRYFMNLSQLFFTIRDNHLAFYQVPDFNNFKNKESIARFVASREFSAYPKYEIDIDSLKAALATRPAESVEGIYHYDQYYSVGLFKSGACEYTGVVVDSDINLWQKGHIALHLYEYGPNLYKAIYAHPLTKSYFLYTNEKYKHQSLVNSYFYGSYTQNTYAKQLRQADHVNLPKNVRKFELKRINPEVQYLLIRSFQADRRTMQKSREFYDSIKIHLTARNLILDLRNNEGGAEKESRKYFKLLKKYSRSGKLFVLVNNGTLSLAEILTLQLKKLKNTTTAGQTTRGMLSYGSNYGKREKLPSGKFEVYVTDMKGKREYLKYEDHGIAPDVTLTDTSDWIGQVIEIIDR